MCHVLIIEDEPLIALEIEQVLRGGGATSVSFAESEEEAVAIARDHRPDFISSDVALSSGVGTSAIRRIHDELGRVPTVIISGNVHIDQPCAPPCPILEKPVDVTRLEAIFRATAVALISRG